MWFQFQHCGSLWQAKLPLPSARISGLPLKWTAKPSRSRCRLRRRPARQKERFAEFRNFQQLTREFIETNAKICHLRPIEEASETSRKKKAEASVKRSRAK